MKLIILFVVCCGGALAFNYRTEYSMGNQDLNAIFDLPELDKKANKLKLEGSKKLPFTSVLTTLTDLGKNLKKTYEFITPRNVRLAEVLANAMKRIQFVQVAITFANITGNIPNGAENDWAINQLLALQASARKIKTKSKEFIDYCESIVDRTCEYREENAMNETAKQLHSAIQEALYHAMVLEVNNYGPDRVKTFSSALSKLEQMKTDLNAIGSPCSTPLVPLMNALCTIGEKIRLLAATEWEGKLHKVLILTELDNLFAFLITNKVLDATTKYLGSGHIESTPTNNYAEHIAQIMPILDVFVTKFDKIASFIADESNRDMTIETYRILWDMLFELNHNRFIFEELIVEVLYGLPGRSSVVEWIRKHNEVGTYKIAANYNFIYNYDYAISRTDTSQKDKWDTMFARIVWAWRYIGQRFETTEMNEAMKALLSKCTKNLQFAQISMRLRDAACRIARSVKIEIKGDVGKCEAQFELFEQADILLEKIVNEKKMDLIIAEHDRREIKNAFQAIFTHIHEMMLEAIIYILKNKRAANAMEKAIATVTARSFNESLPSESGIVNAYNGLGKAFDDIKAPILRIGDFYQGQVETGDDEFRRNIEINTTSFLMLSALFNAYNLSKVYLGFELIDMLLKEIKEIKDDFVTTALIGSTTQSLAAQWNDLTTLVQNIMQLLVRGNTEELASDRLMLFGQIYQLNEINNAVANVVISTVAALWKKLPSVSEEVTKARNRVYEQFGAEIPKSAEIISGNSAVSTKRPRREFESGSEITFIPERPNKRSTTSTTK